MIRDSPYHGCIRQITALSICVSSPFPSIVYDLTNVAAENDNNVQHTSDNTNFSKSRLQQINMASFQVF